MADITIIPAVPCHVRLLGRAMRAADALEGLRLGMIPHRALWRSYRSALIRRTALVDGDVAAMWGVSGVPLGRVGVPWLLTGPACERVSPLALARIYRREAVAMLRYFPVLTNFVDADYEAAIRLLRLAGFALGEPEPRGIDGAPFRKFEMVAP